MPGQKIDIGKSDSQATVYLPTYTYKLYIISFLRACIQFTFLFVHNLDKSQKFTGFTMCAYVQTSKHISPHTGTVLICPNNALIHMRKQHLFKFRRLRNLCKLNQNNVKSALKWCKMKLWLIRFECLSAAVQSKRVASYLPESPHFSTRFYLPEKVKFRRQMKCLCRVDN